MGLALALALLLPPQTLRSQVEDGATMTVLKGEVAVVRADGTAIQPAPSGTIVRAGDEIRTLSRAGALITLFVGTEIELGEETVLAVEQVSRDGARIDISLKQVFGATLHWVQPFTDPGSSYRVSAGGAVVATIPGGSSPRGVTVRPDGARAYTANQGSNNVSVINTATNTVVTTVPIGNFPVGLAAR